MFTSIFWKEYRQQIPMGIALFVIVVVLQLATLMAMAFHGDNWPGGLIVVAITVSALYSASSAAILFCNEHEEKTFSFLRNLPVSRGTVLAGKLTWMFAGSLAFFLLVLLESALLNLICFGANFHFDAGAAIAPVLWIPAACIAFPICWGLFWSPLLRLQLHALLATFISAAVAFWGSYQLVVYLYNGQPSHGVWTDSMVYLMLSLFVGVTFFAGIIGTICGYFWFDIWRDKGNRFAAFRTDFSQETAQVRSMQYAWAKAATGKKRGEFLALCIHAYRQQRTLFLLTIGMGIVTWLGFLFVLTFGDITTGPETIWKIFLKIVVGLWYGILFVTAYVYCASIFSGDQKTRGAFLSERGVAPGKIWWSRVLTFSLPYLGIATLCALTLLIAFILGIYGPLIRLEAHSSPQYDHLVQVFWQAFWQVIKGLCIAAMFIVLPLFVGIFVSIFVRSPIISIVATAGLHYALCIWGVLMLNYLGEWTTINGLNISILNLSIPTLAWSTAPLFLALVVASRLRTDDWLRGRSVRRSRRPVLLCIALTFAAICLAVPFYRVYNIPKIDYGYRADPLVLTADFKNKPVQTIVEGNRRTDETSWDYIRMAPDVQALRQRWESVSLAFTDSSRANVASQYTGIETYIVQRLSELLSPPPPRTADSHTGDVTVKNPPIVVAEIDPQFLDDAIALLHMIDTDRVPYLERIKRTYEQDYRFGLRRQPIKFRDNTDTDGFTHAIFRIFPWERQRYLRRTDYMFQVQSLLTERAKNIIFQSEGNIDAYRQFYNEFYHGINSFTWHWPYVSWIYSPHIDSLYGTERERRTMILRLALIKYVQNNGELPATLDELQTSGILAEIPRIPYTNLPFFYDPNPDGTEPDGGTQFQQPRHQVGTPYLWAGELGDRSDKPWNTSPTGERGLWYDLNFQ